MAWRALEMVLAVWVAVARTVLPAAEGDAGNRVHDVAWAALVIAASLIACLPRGRAASIAVALAAIELVLLGRFGEAHPRSPVAQSYVLTGLTLLMICPLPTRLGRARDRTAVEGM